MHEQHEVFEAPSNPDIFIWRYMDLAKFLSMLQDEALHFARADIMSDEFEGSTSKATVDHWRAIRREDTEIVPQTNSFYRYQRRLIHPDVSEEELRFEEYNTQLAYTMKMIRSYTYLSCWHMNEHESAAMWAIYQSGEPRGIAVRQLGDQVPFCDEASAHKSVCGA